ncbi:MAG: efflux RND transporter periplasmic adaptor subunit [Bacteroidetes bacterium]|nr:efflux RND transporter periplasmic adaptor subunit [Bacteroidota bacterium]MCW5896485.1 efflux RND transporter periplasmic adaptor subunit [Bacteroidota bacterium]
MPRRRTLLLWTFSIPLIGLIAYLATRSADTSPPERANAVSEVDGDVRFPVTVAVAERGVLAKSIGANGILRARREVELLARVGGDVVGVYAQNGKHVGKGDLLVKLDDRESRLAYEKASTALLAAQIEYRALSTSEFLAGPDSARVQEELTRVRQRLADAESAYRTKKIDEAALARARREYEAANAYLLVDRGDIIANKSGLAATQEAYTRAKLDLEATELRAPFAGYVGNLDLTVGKRVQAGTAICNVVDLSTLLVDVDVIESEAPRVQPGQRAELTVAALPGKTFTGKVITRNPMIDPKTKTLKVTIELTNLPTSNSLMPGMYATVRIQTEIFASRLLVPKAALLVRDQRTLVFVAQQGLAKWHYVDVEDENERYIAIRSGIETGDTVIVDGHYTLAHDARIRVTK